MQVRLATCVPLLLFEGCGLLLLELNRRLSLDAGATMVKYLILGQAAPLAAVWYMEVSLPHTCSNVQVTAAVFVQLGSTACKWIMMHSFVNPLSHRVDCWLLSATRIDGTCRYTTTLLSGTALNRAM